MQRLPLFEDGEFLLPPTNWWLWVGLAVTTLVVGGVVFWLARRKEAEKKEGIEEKYLERLSQLRLRMDKLDQYSLMTQVSQILREYIEEKFGIEATKQTTREFLGAILKDGRMIGAHRSLLEDFLQEADLVKFARKHCEADQVEKLHAAAVRLIMEVRL